MKVFSVIGLHNSGKTTCVENLIKYIKSNKMSISSIKDIHQDNFTMEKEGSNSQRHLKASNSYVFARGLKETYLIWNRQLAYKEMLSHISTQWLVVEGMKEIILPKIIAAKNEQEVDELLDDTVFAITGIIADSGIKSYKGLPVISSISESNRLGKLVLEKVFEALPLAKDGYCGHCGFNCYEITAGILNGTKKRTDCALKTGEISGKTAPISIIFNDEEVGINEWVQQIAYDMITGFCQNLKGYKSGEKITIKLN